MSSHASYGMLFSVPALYCMGFSRFRCLFLLFYCTWHQRCDANGARAHYVTALTHNEASSRSLSDLGPLLSSSAAVTDGNGWREGSCFSIKDTPGYESTTLSLPPVLWPPLQLHPLGGHDGLFLLLCRPGCMAWSGIAAQAIPPSRLFGTCRWGAV